MEPGTLQVVYDIVQRLETKIDSYINLGLEHRVRELETGYRRLRNFFWSLLTACVLALGGAYLRSKGVDV